MYICIYIYIYIYIYILLLLYYFHKFLLSTNKAPYLLKQPLVGTKIAFLQITVLS